MITTLRRQHMPRTLVFRSFLVMLTKSTGFLSTTCRWYFIWHFQSKITTLDFFLYEDIKLCKRLKQLLWGTIHLLFRVTLRLFFNCYHVSCIWWIQCSHVVTWFTWFTHDTKERLENLSCAISTDKICFLWKFKKVVDTYSSVTQCEKFWQTVIWQHGEILWISSYKPLVWTSFDLLFSVNNLWETFNCNLMWTISDRHVSFYMNKFWYAFTYHSVYKL